MQWITNALLLCRVEFGTQEKALRRAGIAVMWGVIVGDSFLPDPLTRDTTNFHLPDSLTGDFHLPDPLSRDTNNLLHPDLPESLSREFCRSAFHSGAQAPINGVVQLTDKMLGTKILPHVQFVDGCQHAEFMTRRWHAQQFGVLFGTAVNLLVLQKCVGTAGDKLFGHIENLPANQMKMALRSVEEAAVTGFIHNTLFRPVYRHEGDYWQAKLNAGLVGAGTWASLQASALGIKRLGRGQDNLMGAFLRSEMGSTLLSGVPGGIVQAEMKTALSGKGWADGKELAECIYTQSILGGLWAGGKEAIGGVSSSDTNLNIHMKIASLTARGKEIPHGLLQSSLPLPKDYSHLANPPIIPKFGK